ncbi:MAG: MBOAT family protein [Planctomycetia bacterium]|nr:MBOAT family protein [Planctomycetia bacterium]
MIFNSVTYFLLLAIVVPLWWVLPRRPRLWLVFATSLTFYGFWRWEFLALLMANTGLDYVLALLIHNSDDQRRRKLLLCISLTSNFGALMFFKYLSFLNSNALSLLQLMGFDVRIEWPTIFGASLGDIILPLGISFYVFHTLSYVIDVYRRFIPAQRDFILYTDYVLFFPQLVAGPILRAAEVMPKISQRKPFRLDYISDGVQRILFGLFLKVCLADQIAPLVDSGFDQSVAALSALDVWTLAFLFGFQIYFDFAGYSHIAIGSAKLMGIQFPENFNYPYMATSPRDFWRRWHISLSSWIRDYLYLPLSGAKVMMDHSTGGLAGAAGAEHTERRDFALFASWAIMGLWHGAAWRFLVWGLWHAAFVFLYRTTKPTFTKLPAGVQSIGGWMLTLAIAMLGWIPFRASTLSIAFGMWVKVIDPRQYFAMGLFENTYLITALLMALMVAAYFVETRLAPRSSERPILWLPVQSVAYAFLIAAVFVYLQPIRQFIYFQF